MSDKKEVQLEEEKYQLSAEEIAKIPKELLQSTTNTFPIRHMKVGEEHMAAIDTGDVMIKTTRKMVGIATITLNEIGLTISVATTKSLSASTGNKRACSQADKDATWA